MKKLATIFILIAMTFQVAIGSEMEMGDTRLLLHTEQADKGNEGKEDTEVSIHAPNEHKVFRESPDCVTRSSDNGVPPIVEYPTPPPEKLASYC